MGRGAAVGFAADRHAVSGVEMVVRDGHVRGVSAGLDGDIVVAGMNVTMSDGDIGGGAGVDSVRVSRGLGRIDHHAPGGETISISVVDMEMVSPPGAW